MLVRVRAASLNFPDLLMTRGEYQLKPPLPFMPGMDLAGEVVEADADGAFVPGQAVVGATRLGAFAEYALLDAAALQPKPERLSFAEAAPMARPISPPMSRWSSWAGSRRGSGCWFTARAAGWAWRRSIWPTRLERG